MKFGACCAASKEEEEDARFGHLGTTTEQMQMLRGEMSAFVKPFGIRPHILASITASETVASDHHRLTHESSVVINSHLHFGFEEEDSSEGTNDTSPGTVARIGSGAVVEHCEISGSGWAVGSGAMVSGVRHTGNGWLPGSSQVDTPLFTTESAVVAAASVGTPEATGKGGYDLVVPPGMCVQENAIVWPQHNSETPASGTAVAADGGEEGGYFAVTLLGVSDGVKDLFVEEKKKGTESKNTDGKAPSTVCGVQWLDFFAMSGVSPSDVWPADSTPRQDLWHAKLIPVCRAIAPAHHHHSPAPPPPGVTVLDDWRRAPGVVFWPLWLSAGVVPSAEAVTQWKGLTRLSLKDLLGVASAPTEFKWRRCLETKVGRAIVARAQTQTIAPAVATAAAFVGRHPLKTPSKNTAPLPAPSATSSAAPNIPPKTITLPCAVAKGAATASSSHQPPVTLSSSGGERRQVVQRVKVLRRVVVRAPARIDLAGGWSDTPPISYEHGGAVTNLGVLVDGRHPIVATVTVFEMPLPTSGDGTGDGDHQASLCPLYLSTSSGGDSSNSNGEEEEEEENEGGFGDDVLGVSDLKGLKDFNIPSAPAALLKAALLCAGIVTLSSAEPLLEQLRERCGGGVKVETRSHLPQGSGLGTSSILSGALLCALGHAMGSPFAAIPTDGEVPLLPPRTPLDSADGNQNGEGAKKEEKSEEEGSSLVHAVLMLEQMLTTGGGWQDQVGGCSPSAATIATSLPTLPLRVHCRPLTLPNGFADDLSKHLCLVFTGAPRLAKHLLVEVLRRWWSHEPNVRATAGALVGGAHTCAEALERGDLEGVGAALTNYHGMKRVMAGEGYDGEVGPALASTLNPFAHGLAYCGAGGGGFLAVLTKVPLDEPFVRSVEPEGGGSSSPSSKKMKSCFEALSAVVEAHGGSVHRVQLAPSGLVVTTHTH
jgi:galactokinase/mevalonate kinase-like predicted kinase